MLTVDEVITIARTVWSTILGVDLSVATPLVEPGPAGRPAFEARILIAGAWDGAVVLQCGRSTASRAAATLFGVDPAETTTEQMSDVVGELTNVLGGNIKALLPQPSRLGLPIVAEVGEVEGEHDRHVVTDVRLTCAGDPLRVLLVRDPA